VVVNGNGSVNGQGMGSTSIQGVEQIPEGQQLSPLTSPLLTEAGYIRNDDEDEARRKVGIPIPLHPFCLISNKITQDLRI